jgi:hypothetical protein
MAGWYRKIRPNYLSPAGSTPHLTNTNKVLKGKVGQIFPRKCRPKVSRRSCAHI